MPELQDLYDRFRRPTGEQYMRGVDAVPEGRYRLGVQVWIRNDRGQFLLSQRHPKKKSHPLYWEPTGGGVEAGEDTRSAGVREVSEELGIALDPEKLALIRTVFRRDMPEFTDVYLARWNGAIEELTLQDTEVADALWAGWDDLERLERQGVFEEDYRKAFGDVRAIPAAVCPMRMEDYEEVIKLWRDTPGMGINDVDDSAEGMKRFLARNPGMSFVAKTEDGIVGTILCGHDGRRGYLYHAAVLPKMRGMGVGRALVNAALDALREAGISKVGLNVFADNAQGLRFWEKFGFDARDDVKYRSLRLMEMNEINTK